MLQNFFKRKRNTHRHIQLTTIGHSITVVKSGFQVVRIFFSGDQMALTGIWIKAWRWLPVAHCMRVNFLVSLLLGLYHFSIVTACQPFLEPSESSILFWHSSRALRLKIGFDFIKIAKSQSSKKEQEFYEVLFCIHQNPYHWTASVHLPCTFEKGDIVVGLNHKSWSSHF